MKNYEWGFFCEQHVNVALLTVCMYLPCTGSCFFFAGRQVFDGCTRLYAEPPHTGMAATYIILYIIIFYNNILYNNIILYYNIIIYILLFLLLYMSVWFLILQWGVPLTYRPYKTSHYNITNGFFVITILLLINYYVIFKFCTTL